MTPVEAYGEILARCQDFEWRYAGSDRMALQDVAIDIAKGDRIILIGPTGSGKTTLMLALSGLLRQRFTGKCGGQAVVCGLDALSETPATIARHVALVSEFADEYSFSALVRDELRFAHAFRVSDPEQREQSWRDTTRSLKLEYLLRRHRDALSGGERKLVSIGCSLPLKIEIVLADISLDALDRFNRAQVLGILHAVSQRGGAVCHTGYRLPSRPSGFNRVVLIEGGRLKEDCSYEQFIAKAEEDTSLMRYLPERVVYSVQTVGQAPERGHGEENNETESAKPNIDVVPFDVRAHDLPHLRVSGVTVRLGGSINALRDVTVHIKNSHWTALVGRNGSGKTTFLRLVAGLESATNGRIELFGRERFNPVVEPHPKVAFMMQDSEFQVIGETVEEELLLSSARVAATQTGESNRSRVEMLLHEFELQSYRDAETWDLAPHVRRSLVLASCLSAAPSLLLLDEPTATIDPEAGMRILQTCRHITSLSGVTVLVATHSFAHVAQYCDQVVGFAAGCCEFDTSKSEFMRCPDLATMVGIGEDTAPQASEAFSATP